jgi:quinoprotein glucose dehydrogenase
MVHSRTSPPCQTPVPWKAGLFCALFPFFPAQAGDEAQLKLAAQGGVVPKIATASDEGVNALKQFQLANGLSASLWAAEPLLAHPVAITPDNHGRWYVAETFRVHAGVSDVMVHKHWIESELASTSLDSWLAILKGDPAIDLARTAQNSERVQLLWDSQGTGRADRSTVFAEGFQEPLSGIAAGVLARKDRVYLACVPDLWQLRDTRNTGEADERKSLARGFGVRTGVLGHDLHGLRLGPDGRLYFSMGDRGANATAWDGSKVFQPETGAVYRCNQDGSELELFAAGLRNPQDLVFDEYGNLFTVDNNTSFGEPSRVVYILPGGDSGWRIGWQFLTQAPRGGPWVSERFGFPAFEGQAAHHVPAVAGLSNGPSGLAYNPGTALSERWRGHFFLADFRGSPANSGIHAFSLKPKGAGFEMILGEKPVWRILATDAKFGVDGALYLADWVNGWGLTGKGRIYRVTDEAAEASPMVRETQQILAAGMENRSTPELGRLLAHPDQRIRQEAQFELAERRDADTLNSVLAGNGPALARIHGVWGLGQIGRSEPKTVARLLPFLSDPDATVREQAVKTLGDLRSAAAAPEMVQLLEDESARVRSMAAIGLGRIGHPSATPPLLALLRSNRDQDPVLRYAAVSGLVGCATPETLEAVNNDSHRSARIGAVNALRRLRHPGVAVFLKDSDAGVVAEAARAIYDESIESALPALAALLGEAGRLLKFPEGTAEQPGPRDAVLRRAIRANFRLGGHAHATALAEFLRLPGLPEVLAVEAMACCAEWPCPSNLDRVMGLYRPLATRDPAGVREVVAGSLAPWIQSGPKPVRMAALALVTQFRLRTVPVDFAALVRNAGEDAEVRAEALRAMAARQDSGLAEAVVLAADDASETLRKEALTLLVKSAPEGGVFPPLVRVLKKGSIGEKQNVLTMLGDVPGADPVLVQQMQELLAGRLNPELHLELLEAAAKRQSPELQALLKKHQDALPAGDSLAAYRVALQGGNPVEGRKVFMEKLEASCVRCHKVKNEGGDVGPDLTKVGARSPREYLLESIVEPNARIAAGYESVVVNTKDGAVHAGILRDETHAELVLMPPSGVPEVIPKPQIASREKGLSGMPPLGLVLSKRDLRDVVEYLARLK